ncbi:glycine cleavage system protein H [Marinitoga sp. 1135]|uniref:Glycine cleavage system H protein n=2 Tax=Petrotogaceae TaxID=1643949 RepID=H2J380_MARPK|nr:MULTISPECIES: glycine cleavage system protein GcvH [Marinitoga]AEX84598.1 glycine cleavage system H protein [Marinitoga piezophila KA3]APT75117.1 glycine cleavage system protein H [Marinitoga sp. 1137]NUU94890.1 glycine cleavage system protein H [Marinitoga sp. 1135]NUU96828.1 glycine cleavage system protein H [Marinitoga sp. 1138]
MKKYTKTHEWVEVEGNIATIGITAHAAEELGDITYVDLPEEGKEIKKGEALCAVESVKSASDVYSPVSGKVIEVNSELDASPELINDDAENAGWIVKMEISDESELDELLSEEEYKNSL